MIFDQKLSKQRSNSLIKEHDVTTVKKSSNGQNLSILWKETTSSDGLLDYNLISVLESHRLMGIGNSNWTWFFFKSWPKLLTFKCESALKIINVMKKLKKIKSQILFHTFLHELILGTWWPDPSISLFWGTLIIYKNAIRGQFSLYFWLNSTDGILLYINEEKIYLEMIYFKTYKRFFSVDCSLQFLRKNICNNFLR